MFMAQRAVDAFMMRDIGPIGRIAIMAGVVVTCGTEIIVIVTVRFIETVVGGVGGEPDGSSLDHRLHCVQIAAAMGGVTAITLLDIGGLRGCAVTFVSVSADIRAGSIRISVAAGAEGVRSSPQAGIVRGFKVRGVGIMAGLTVQIFAMTIAHPVAVDGRGGVAVQPAWLGCVVAAGAVADRPDAVPGRFGFETPEALPWQVSHTVVSTST